MTTSMHRRGSGGRPHDEPMYLSPTSMDFEERVSRRTSKNIFSFVTVTANYNAVGVPIILADASVSFMNVTLPTSSVSTNKVYYVKKIDSTSNFVRLLPRFGSKIDGATYMDITTQYTCLTVICDGTNWWII